MKHFLAQALSKLQNIEPLRVGQPAPRVKGYDQDGERVDLGAAYDQGPVVLFFYPKASSPGCTSQACSLGRAYDKLHERGATIFGVSADSMEEQRKFRERHRLPFRLLADPEGDIIRAFHVPRLGKFAMRQAFLIRDARVAWKDLAASTSQQAEDVLNALGRE